MLTPLPPRKPPSGASPAEMQAWRMMRDAVEPLARFQSPHFQGGGLPTEVPGIPEHLDMIIQGRGGSGSGGSGSGIALPADDQPNAYEWVEAEWYVRGDDFDFREKVGGMRGTFNSFPAVEANGATDVPEGVCVMGWLDQAGAYPFYKFWWTGGEGGGSGSGGGGTFSGTCQDGSPFTVSINGNSVTVT